MSEQLILRCENSLVGIFSAVSDAFEHKEKLGKPYTDSISIVIGDDGEVSSGEQMVAADAGKVEQIVRV